MVSKHYFQSLVIGTAFITLTGLAMGYSLFKLEKITLSVFIGLILIIETGAFISRLNNLNRKIATFLNSVQNADTSFRISDKSSNKTIRELYESLNHVIDVFRNMKMENEFREQLFLSMIEHSSTGFISIDQYGDFEIMNETSRKLLDVHYTSSMQRLKGENPDLYNVINTLGPGQVKSCKIRTNRITTIIQVSASLLRFKNKELKLVSLLDIKKEIELRELESWQKLIRIMNHEIMNSIAPITSVSKSLIKIFMDGNQPVDIDQLDKKKICDTINGLEVIESMSSGLSHFVGHYRQLAQVPKPEIKPINLNKWKDGLSAIGQEIASASGASFEAVTEFGCCNVSGDEHLLNQVIINLIKNAAEAPLNGQDKEIKLSFGQNEKGKTIIEVWNNGKAIEDEELDKIFVPFFTTKEQGAGIGLFLSRQIITLHQGVLSVSSSPQNGTAFIIEI